MPEPERVTPSPGEIAETIIAEFYKDYRPPEVRIEEMLKRIWVLLLEQKAERGGFDDPGDTQPG